MLFLKHNAILLDEFKQEHLQAQLMTRTACEKFCVAKTAQNIQQWWKYKNERKTEEESSSDSGMWVLHCM